MLTRQSATGSTALVRAHVLCFTESRETAHRLCLLLQQYKGPTSVMEIAVNTKLSKRQKILKDIIAGKTEVNIITLDVSPFLLTGLVLQVLICSDSMTRGVDIDGVQS